MKRIILALTTAIMLCAPAQGKNRTVTENDSLGNVKRVIELKDTTIGGKTVTDTLSVTTYENNASRDSESTAEDNKHHSSDYDFGWNIAGGIHETLISIIAIVSVFGLPAVVIFTVFFFRYKNRQAKYRLMEQALASGQPLPEHLFKETDATDIHSKGIKNVFTGIGLFIFLWAITGKFSIGCVGLLIMFTGLGQLVIHYTQQSKDGNPFVRIKNDRENGRRNVKIGGIEIEDRKQNDEE